MVGFKGLVAAAAAAVVAGDVVRNDTAFYGESPPVYPSPEMSGQGWADAYARAKTLVAQMTLEEKVSLTGGVQDFGNGCSGNIPNITRVGFPGMCLNDAGQGVRGGDFVSGFPSGIHVGASWNKDLTARRGAAMANEFKKKGINVLLGPVVGPAWRVTLSGRNWEGFSADPYLSGSLAADTITAAQAQGVMASTKHFIANEQETNRNPDNGVESTSSNIDDKTMHELYLWPFQDAVHAGSGNIMCSYQRVNNSYGCANSKTLNGLLKTELGFQGFVVSDWGAQHTGYAGALAGMDMAMPDPGTFWGDKLVESVKNGSVPESRITDMAHRIITSWYQFKQDVDFKSPGIGMPKNIIEPHKIVDARDPAARKTLYDGAVEGHVLVKNTKDTLPLGKPQLISAFGYSANTPAFFAPGRDLKLFQWQLGAETISTEEVIAGALGTPGNASSIGINGTLFGGCGSGAITPANAISPIEALRARTYHDGTALFADLASPDPVVDPASDVCIVFGNAFACEAYDRTELQDEYTDKLINTVADSCNKTIVVLHNAGPRTVDGFIEHPNVTAVLFAHLPGQESGNALVSLLYGEENPSGKLPYTLAKNATDYPVLKPTQPEGDYKNFPQSNFSEGVFLDYRHFDKAGVDPRYEFGYGMSYTSFNVSNAQLGRVDGGNSQDEYPSGAIIQGGHADLWDNVVTVSADVENTGKVAGAEVVQVYVGIPGEGVPKRQLRGFAKIHLSPGVKRGVRMALSRRDLSVWSVERQMWRLQRGEYTVWVGTSSRDLPLEMKLTI